MQITTRLRYGVRAIIEIGRRFGETPIKRREIVSSQGIPDSYLENILITLKERGIIRTIRGAKGGYLLTRPPKRITVLEIAEALDGPVLPTDCLEHPSGCDRVSTCATRPLWDRLKKAHEEVLEGTTVQDLIDADQAEYVLDFCI